MPQELTYQDLLEKLQRLTPDQLQQTALIRLELSEEIIGIQTFMPSQSDDKMGDVVDEGQYLLGVNY
jgi:hypothetical protein